ncbi:MAG: hypothetical protein II008_20055 [Oscillospiraceae bacterium]|nr:hypothetical protein [Oscillospiraceae bacterium]
MDKKKRKEEIGRLSLIATLVYDEIARNGHGVVSLQPHMDARNDLKMIPGAHLQPALFMELFGDDTEYEYVDSDYGKYVATNVNGVTVYALINGTDLIQEGRIV